MLRKTIVLFSILIFCSGFISAQNKDVYIGDGGNGKRLLVHRATLENPIEGKKDLYLEKNITEAVTNDIVNFSKINPINTDDIVVAKDIQKESETAAYDENTDIELGKLKNANQVLRIIITRRPSDDFYMATFSITNVTTGMRDAGNSTKYFKESDFLKYAHGYLTVDILKAMGVTVTKAGERYIIGETLNSTASTINDAKEDKNLIDEMLRKANEELSKIDISKLTAADAEAQKIRQMQQISLLKQRKTQAEERIKRIEADEKRKQEDELKRQKLNSQQQKALLETSASIERKAEEIRKQKVAALTAYEKITVIENEKKTLLDMNNEIIENIDHYREQSESDYRAQIRELKQDFMQGGKWDIYYKDGEMTEQGKKHLNENMRILEEEKRENQEAAEQEIWDKNAEPLRILRNKISDDIAKLEKTVYKTSSIGDPNVYFRVNDYDFDQNGWNYTISFGFDGQNAYYDEGILNYEAITGKQPVEYSRETVEEYEDFIQEVQSIDSYFRTNIGYVIAELNYKVKTKSFDQPSQYEILVQKLSFKVWDAEKNFATVKVSSDYEYQYNPITAIDWRNDKIVKKDNEKQQQQIRYETKKAQEKRRRLEQEEQERHRLETEAYEKRAREIEQQKKEAERKAKKEKYEKKLDSNFGVFFDLAGSYVFGEPGSVYGANIGFSANATMIGIGSTLSLRSRSDNSFSVMMTADGTFGYGVVNAIGGIGFASNIYYNNCAVYYLGGKICYKHLLAGYKYISNMDKDICHEIFLGVRF